MDKIIEAPQKIILTDRVGNINKKFRIQNFSYNRDILNMEARSLKEMAFELITAYSAFFEDGKAYSFITPAMQEMILTVILKKGEYGFLPVESKGLRTAEEILSVMKQIRMNRTTQEFDGSTDSKVVEIKGIIRDYEERLKSKDELDEPLLFRKALDILNTLKQRQTGGSQLAMLLPYIGDSRFYLADDYELTELEKDFLKSLMKLAGKDEPERMSKAGDPENGGGTPDIRFFKAYGSLNEISHIAGYITENRLQFGNTAIIYGSPSYENVIRAVLDRNGIPYTFPRGSHAATTDYISLYIDILDFAAEDFSYKELHKVINNPVFKLTGSKKLYRKVLREGIGWGYERYSDFIKRYNALTEGDELKNTPGMDEFIQFMSGITGIFIEGRSCETLFRELMLFVKKYTPDGLLDKRRMNESLKAEARVLSLADSGNSMIDNIKLCRDFLEDMVFDEAEEPDRISVYPYGSREVIDREHLFIVGLSNENLSRPVPDSPVMTDKELQRYIKGKLSLSSLKNAERKENMEYTLDTMTSGDVSLSYSFYDTVKLMNNSPSLFWLEKLAKAGIKEKDVDSYGYEVFTEDIRIEKKDYSEYWENRASVMAQAEENAEKPDGDREMPGYSASSLQMLIHCPLSYYYRKVMRIPEISYQERKPHIWLELNQRGNLLHHTFQRYVEDAVMKRGLTGLDEDALKKYFEEEINDFKRIQPCNSKEIYMRETEECYNTAVLYLESLHRELNSEPGRKVLGCELEFKDVPYTGGDMEEDRNYTYTLLFNGSVDRLDGAVKDGILELYIVDYKTGSFDSLSNKIKKDEQIQHYVYALAAFEYADKNRAELEKLFNAKINGTRIAAMKYVFPFEIENGSYELSASDKVNDAGDTAEVRLPGSVEILLREFEGNMQHGRREEALEAAENTARDCLADEEDRNDLRMCSYCTYSDICAARL
ncbi:MAG: PD-(D/E)XK nuclease family protein [Lachnospiraceae bacterium]|nr:PD-(D/E)XK nuclease family protein [Lachnospiraceae bacterium]